MVVLGGPAASPRVVARVRIALADTDDTEQLQAYHRAEDLPLAEARRLVDHAHLAARTVARTSLRTALAGRVASRAAIVGGNSRLPDELAAILRSHVVIHAAEGALFRGALADACAHCGVAAVEIPSSELEVSAKRLIGLDGSKLRARLVALGAELGSPWAADQKQAALAAWLALYASPTRSSNAE